MQLKNVFNLNLNENRKIRPPSCSKFLFQIGEHAVFGPCPEVLPTKQSYGSLEIDYWLVLHKAFVPGNSFHLEVPFRDLEAIPECLKTAEKQGVSEVLLVGVRTFWVAMRNWTWSKTASLAASKESTFETHEPNKCVQKWTQRGSQRRTFELILL